MRATLVLALVLSGCAGSLHAGRFDGSAYMHAEFPYAVRPPYGEEILPADWTLDNYQRDRTGRPTALKTTAEYVTTVEFDRDGDGRTDETRRWPIYDLRYVNRHNAGSMWLRTLPVESALGETDLRVLMRNYVDSISGGGFVSARIGRGIDVGVSRHFATRILSGQRLRVHGVDAFSATIEVASIEQLQLTPNARWERAQVVILHAPFRFPLPSSQSSVPTMFPVMMLAVYSNLPEDFDSGLPAFQRLVGAIEFRDAPPGVARGVQVVGPAAPLDQPTVPPAGAPPPLDQSTVPPAGAPPPLDQSTVPPAGAPPPLDQSTVPPAGSPPTSGSISL